MVGKLHVDMGFIEEELCQVRDKVKDLSHAELIACHPSMVQIKVR